MLINSLSQINNIFIDLFQFTACLSNRLVNVSVNGTLYLGKDYVLNHESRNNIDYNYAMG